MKRNKSKLLEYWISLIKRRKKLEKEKKEKERIGILFYFKQGFLVTGAFTLGLFISPKKKKEESKNISLEEHLKSIKKIKKEAKETDAIDKINDLKLSLEMEEAELKDEKIEQNEIYIDCEEELEEAKYIITEKIKKFENRLEENIVRVKIKENKIEKEKKENKIRENEKEEKIEKKDTIDQKNIIKEVSIPIIQGTIAGTGLILEGIVKNESKEKKELSEIKDKIESKETMEKQIEKVSSEPKEIKSEEKEKQTIVEDVNQTIEEVINLEPTSNIEITNDMDRKETKQIISKEEVFDYIMMSKLIDENIKKNKQKVDELKKEMKELHPILRKQTFLGKLQIYMSGITKSVLSFLPMKLFKNKTIGILTSSVLINNSIRSMRNTMRKEEYFLDYLNYERVNNKITSTISDMDKIYYICEDSLEHISSFRTELLGKYEMNEDLEKILNEISSIEISVMKKMNSIENTKEDLKEKREEVKQKILKKEV